MPKTLQALHYVLYDMQRRLTAWHSSPALSPHRSASAGALCLARLAQAKDAWGQSRYVLYVYARDRQTRRRGKRLHSNHYCVVIVIEISINTPRRDFCFSRRNPWRGELRSMDYRQKLLFMKQSTGPGMGFDVCSLPGAGHGRESIACAVHCDSSFPSSVRGRA